jgi:ribonuclease Z
MHVATVDDGPRRRVLGAQLSEADHPGQINVETALSMGVRLGPEFGQLQRGETVRGIRLEQVLGPTRRGRRLSVLGPCRPTDQAVKLSAASQLLLAVTPYTEEKQDLAVETNVMTGVEAALLATEAHVEALALLHVAQMPRMTYARREAAQFHDPVYLPGDGDEFSIPLPDNGPVGHRTPTTAEQPNRHARHGGETHGSHPR